ncbi:hypothetical protein FRB94_007598 [Tulasnella sp. JGI-2019a]|nr:hypothetical protein FRB94_007598 [Tulasnella sp. JGI-2019a]
MSHRNTLSLIRKFAFLSVPQLEKLTIDCDIKMELSPKDRIDLFGGGAGRLQHINFDSFPIPWNSRLLSQLETIKLSGLRGCPGPATNEILRRCPKLRALNLGYKTGEGIHVSDSTPSEMEAVDLPVLTSFVLSLNNGEAFSQIISVRIPACTQLSLSCSDQIYNFFLGGGLTVIVLKMTTLYSEISLSLLNSGLSLYGVHHQSDPVIYITLWLEHHQREALAWLTECTARSVLWPQISATIVCNDSLLFLQVANFLRRMPSITKLKIYGNSDQYITLLTPINGACEWILPNLRELSLEDCLQNSPQLLNDLLAKRRGGLPVNQEDRELLRLPMDLEKVYIGTTDLWGESRAGPLYTALQQSKGRNWDGNMIE